MVTRNFCDKNDSVGIETSTWIALFARRNFFISLRYTSKKRKFSVIIFRLAQYYFKNQNRASISPRMDFSTFGLLFPNIYQKLYKIIIFVFFFNFCYHYFRIFDFFQPILCERERTKRSELYDWLYHITVWKQT